MELEMASMQARGGTTRSLHRRSLSLHVRRLQEALVNLFNERDRSDFVDSLNEYHSRRNVYEFVQMMKILLDTPVKRQMVPLLRKVIPQSDVPLFDRYISEDGLYPVPTANATQPQTPITAAVHGNTFPRQGYPVSRTSSMPNVNSTGKKGKMQKRGDDSGYATAGRQKLHPQRSSRPQESPTPTEVVTVKRVYLRQSKDKKETLGFSIRGGAEHGIGIYVSFVETGSPAEHQGLAPGDQIVAVNDYSFDKITHEQAAKIIKSAKKLDLTVKNVGRIPGSYVVHQTYTWVDPQGRPVSPPPEIDRSGRYESKGERKSGLMLLKDSDERKVNVVVEDGQSLGLMIRGGNEFGLGIYITGVDPYSVAENAGLKIGDQILDVNGQSFLDISHADAVKVLKSSRHMMMTIKDVGRLPYARTTYDQTQWIMGNQNQVKSKQPFLSNGYGSAERRPVRTDQPDLPPLQSVFSRGAGSQLMYNPTASQQWGMIEEQSRQLLNETERGTLNYYLNEYQKDHVTVDALVLALFELLNTHAKFSLLSEIRTIISPKDIDRFDTLVLKKEVESMKVSGDGKSITPPVVPAKLPPHVKVSHENNNDPLTAAIEQINDDTDGLPDFFRGDNNINEIQATHAVPVQSSPKENVIVAEVHQEAKAPPPLIYEDMRSPSEDSGVEVNGCSNNTDQHHGVHQKKPESLRHSPVPSPHRTPQNSPRREEEPPQYTANESPIMQQKFNLALESTPPRSPEVERSPGRQVQVRDMDGLGPVQIHKKETSPPDSSRSSQSDSQEDDLLKALDAAVEDYEPPQPPNFPPPPPPEPVLPPAPVVPVVEPREQAPKPEPEADMARGRDEVINPENVTVYKTQPTLGVAIEGGANTRQPLPRIINIQKIRILKLRPKIGIGIVGGAGTVEPLPKVIDVKPGGSAHESGGLKVGHVILEVDGQSLKGLEHKQVAQVIAKAFKKKDKDYMELLVAETNSRQAKVK
ncbi:whirlin-like isoform X3 [Lineus longissimus]|uniref:whirlin-like isoform X3 n=1 Tax=Lineus longissimus TaxID=88925 RepID=UPI00315DC772